MWGVGRQRSERGTGWMQNGTTVTQCWLSARALNAAHIGIYRHLPIPRRWQALAPSLHQVRTICHQTPCLTQA